MAPKAPTAPVPPKLPPKDWLGKPEDVSQSTRELDKLGGRHRPAVKRGNSLEKRMQWLQESLVQQQSDYESALSRNEDNARWEMDQQTRRKRSQPKYVFAFGRKQLAGEVEGGSSPKSPLEQPASPVKSAPATPVKAKQLALIVPKAHKRGSMFSPKTPTRAQMPPLWRERVTRAKRKFRQALGVVSAFKLALPATGPRLERMDSYSMLLVSVLGQDCPRFAEAQCKVQRLLDKAQRLMQGSAAAGSQAAPAPLAGQPPAAAPAADAPAAPAAAAAAARTEAARGGSDAAVGAHAAEIEDVRTGIIRSQLAEDEEERVKAVQMVRMLANRSNARWVEAREWAPPQALEVARFVRLLGGAQHELFRHQVMGMLAAGEVAVQLLAGEDAVTLADGAQQPVFTCDAWGLVRAVCPHRLPGVNDRVEGLTFGQRQLLALRMAVEALAGADALQRMVLIIHTSVDQEPQLLQDLRTHRLYGFQRQNVVILPQQRQAGYGWSADARGFLRQFDTQPCLHGSGYMMMQLAWDREAFALAENLTTREFIKGSVLTMLEQKGVRWLSSGRACDLARCSTEGALDVDALAYTLKLAEERGANCSFEVKTADGLVGARQQNSLVLALKDDSRGRRGDRDPPCFAVDLKHGDLQSHKLAGLLAEYSKAAQGQLHVNTDRYWFELTALAAQLRKGHRAFHPDVDLRQHIAYMSFHMADLTACPEVCAVPLVSKMPLQTLRTHKQVEEMVPLLAKQDKDPAFRQAVAALHKLSGRAGQPSGPAQASERGLHMMLFLTDNEASSNAVALVRTLLRPGADAVSLATSIMDQQGHAEAQRLLARHRESFDLGVQICTDVLVRGTQGLVDALLEHTASRQADVVVMGSHQLGKPDSALIGSVTLSYLKRCDRPMIITRPATTVPKADGGAVRAMVVVDHASRPLLNWAVTRLLSAQRGDKVLLARANAKDAAAQDTMTTRQLLDQFGDLAAAKRYAVVKRPLTGASPTDAYVAAADADKVHLLAVQAPMDKAIPSSVVEVLRASKAAVLLVRTNQQW